MPYTRLQVNFARMMALLGLAPPPWREPGTSLVILHYHHFTEGPPSSFLEVRASVVRAQLEILSQRFAFLSLRESLDELLGGGRLHGRKPGVVISIDDAFKSFDMVRPAFEALQVPVVIFAPIGLCLDQSSDDGLRSRCLRYYAELKAGLAGPDVPGSPEEFFDVLMNASSSELGRWEVKLRQLPRVPDPITVQEKYSIEELQELTRHPLVKVASHSMSHQNLAQLSPKWRSWEIRSAARYLADLGGEAELFAYPFGEPGTFSESCSAILKDAGVKYACTTIPFPVTHRTPPLLLGRTLLLDCVHPQYLWGVAGGAFEWWHKLRHGFLGRKLVPAG